MSQCSTKNISYLTEVDKGACTYYPADLCLATIAALCSIVGAFMNLFVLKMLGRKVFGGSSSSMNNRSPGTNTTFLLLCTLAAADLGNLLLPSPFSAFALYYGRFALKVKITQLELESELWYMILINFVGFCANWFVMGSISLICIISIRRAIALYLPFKYNSYFKPFKVYIMVSTTSLFSVLIALLPFYVSDHYAYMADYANVIAYLGKFENLLSGVNYIAMVMVVTVVVVTIPATIIAISSGMVVARLHNRRRKVQYRKVQKSRKESEENAARTVTIIPIIFLICHLPVVYRITSSFIMMLYQQLSPEKMPMLTGSDKNVRDYVKIVAHFILPTINSCINPFVYLLGSNKMKGNANVYAKECFSKFGKSVTCQKGAVPNPRDGMQGDEDGEVNMETTKMTRGYTTQPTPIADKNGLLPVYD